MDAHHRLISSMHQLAIAPLCYKFKNLKAKSLLFQLISIKKLSTLNLIFLSLEITNYSKGLNHLVFNQFLNLDLKKLPVLDINVLFGNQTSASQNVAAFQSNLLNKI